MNQRPRKQNSEVPENIVIESDIHIKQEVFDDCYVEYDVVDNLDWCHESSEQPIKSEKPEPLTKKRKRKKEPQINSKGINFYTVINRYVALLFAQLCGAQNRPRSIRGQKF